MRIALITGASSGLGKTFALQIDRTEKNIDEIWLIARRRERLEELAGRLTHTAKIIPMDLTKEESIDELEKLLAGDESAGERALLPSEDKSEGKEKLLPSEDKNEGKEKLLPSEDKSEGKGKLLPSEDKSEGKEKLLPSEDKSEGKGKLLPSEDKSEGKGKLLPSEDKSEGKEKLLPSEDKSEGKEKLLLSEDIRVGLFVNCAGYAKIGNYEKVTRFDSANMIDLNCKAAVNTTLAALPHMRAGDRIIEICSTAAFQPIQHMNLYAASKAFLYSYTRALRMELLPRGIIVTAVCPWWVKDTEFISVAQDNDANPDVKAAIKGFPLSTKQSRVVKTALRDSRIGLAVSTPGVMCFFHRIFAKVIPRKWLLYFWEIFRRIG